MIVGDSFFILGWSTLFFYLSRSGVKFLSGGGGGKKSFSCETHLQLRCCAELINFTLCVV